MTVDTENSIKVLSLNNAEALFSELNLMKFVLEKLFESDVAQVPKEEIFNDVLKIIETAERMKKAETPRQKFDVYYLEYRTLANELRVKYSDFVARDTFKEIKACEKYTDGLRELIIAQEIMLIAFDNETSKLNQSGTLYTGMMKLSELVEEYLPYFPQELIEYIKNIASTFLSDSSLKPDRATQDESVFTYLIGLKNTAKAVLWHIREYQTENGKSHLTAFPWMNSDLAREMQIQRNQAAIDWSRSRLDHIKSIRKAKG